MARSILPKSIRKRIPLIIALAWTVFFIGLTFVHRDLADNSFLTGLELRWTDQKFQWRGPQTPGNEVIIVGVDDATTRKLGSARMFLKSHWADLIDRVAEGKPKAIGFDILFEDVDVGSPDNDRKFADAIQRAGNVVLGVRLQLEQASGRQRTEQPLSDELQSLSVDKQVFSAEQRDSANEPRLVNSVIRGRALEQNLPQFMTACASFGFVNFHPDESGRLRHQPEFIDYASSLWPSLDLQLLRRYMGAPSPIVHLSHGDITEVELGNSDIPTDQFGRYMLNFDGPVGTHRTVSMIDVLEGRVAADTFKDKIVLIGAPAVGLSDIVSTPFDPVLPGVDLHANVIDNILHQRYLFRNATTQFVDIAIILAAGVLMGVYLPRMNATRSVFYTGLLLAAFTAINYWAFTNLHWVLSFIYPGMALVFTSGSLISYKYFTEEREKKRTKQTFQYYLDQHVIEQVMNQPELLKLGGEKRDMSVLFSDIRGFTSFSEKMAPTEVVNFLNQYFNRMSGLIFQYKGTLDKLIGDAVMCFWGHPLVTEEHALRATLCALEMIRAVEDLRPVLILPGGAKFEIGIGVNTGQMVVGNMGSQNRFSYTVMGDNVNLGSRLESLNKYYGTRILIADSTYEEIRHVVFCRQLDTIQVKGKSQAVTIYEPLGMRRWQDEHRRTDRRGESTLPKRIKAAYILARFGERRQEERRMGSERLLVKPEQEEIAAIYEHALALYRRGDFEAAGKAFDHVLSLSPTDGPARLMKERISKYKAEYAGSVSHFDPVYKFDEK